MLVYPSGLDVSSSALCFLSAKLRRHRRALGTRWRRLSTGRQALLVLAHLGNGHPYTQLAAGFGIGTTTAYRYISEAERGHVEGPSCRARPAHLAVAAGLADVARPHVLRHVRHRPHPYRHRRPSCSATPHGLHLDFHTLPTDDDLEAAIARLAVDR